ncbi:MAG: DUF2764 family protein [Bacteroidales bacterium]
MPAHYHYLVSGLPVLNIDVQKLTVSSVEFKEQLLQGLSRQDMQLVEWLFLRFDHENLLHLMFNREEPWDNRGNFSREELEQLLDKKGIAMRDITKYPDYFQRFLQDVHGKEAPESQASASRRLSSGYYDFLDRLKNPFMQKTSGYERNMANITTALNARKYELDPENLLIGEDEITETIKNSRAADFGLSSRIGYIEELLEIFESGNIQEREMKLDMHKWRYLEDITFFNYFTVERILAFLLKLFIVERWYGLDKEKGMEIFKKLFNEIKSGFEFPEEYSLSYGKKT